MTELESETLRRLPLAEGVLRLLQHALPDADLQRLYDDHRGQSYQDVLRFDTFFHLIRDALLHRGDSAHQHFRKARRDGVLPVTIEAVYGKLRRVPPGVSQALLAEGTRRLAAVSSGAVDPLPPSVAGMEVLAFDGKQIKHVPKRLKALRNLWGKLSGGKLLVVQDVATRMAVAFAADADGLVADNTLVEGAVAQVRQRPSDRPRLWVGDRLFGNLVETTRFHAAGEFYLLRYHSKTSFAPDSSREMRKGVTADGLAWHEEWGWYGRASDGRRQYVRRIHLATGKTTPKGKPDHFSVVTNLLDADAYPAADLLATYRRRWSIESLFQEVTDVFHLKDLIGTTPQAMIFQASLVLLLSNALRVLTGYLAQTRNCVPSAVSTELVFKDVVAQLTALTVMVDAAAVGPLLEPMDADELKAWLARRLSGAWDPRWAKQKTVRRKPKPLGRVLKGRYGSVDRILRGVHQTVPLRNPPRKRKNG